MRSHPLVHLSRVKFLEFVREPEAIFWVLVFPVLLSLALGIAFRSKAPAPMAIAVADGPGSRGGGPRLGRRSRPASQGAAGAGGAGGLAHGQGRARRAPRRPLTYWFDPARDECLVARLAADGALQRAAGRADARATTLREMNEKGSRYIDFLVPGLLGMNLMGTGMWGIGFSIVTARSRGLLKRLVATPMRKRDYLLGQMMGRMVFLIPEVVVLVGFAHVAFGVPVKGPLLALALVTVLGATAFTGIGLLVAARPRTIEGVSGLMNFVMLPMWIFSGVFFSPSRFPDAILPVIRLLPLTALNDALRAVMIDGASLASVSAELGILCVWGAIAFAIALYLFRWQ